MRIITEEVFHNKLKTIPFKIQAITALFFIGYTVARYYTDITKMLTWMAAIPVFLILQQLSIPKFKVTISEEKIRYQTQTFIGAVTQEIRFVDIKKVSLLGDAVYSITISDGKKTMVLGGLENMEKILLLVRERVPANIIEKLNRPPITFDYIFILVLLVIILVIAFLYLRYSFGI